MKLLWSKWASVVEIFSPFRDIMHSENKDERVLSTEYGVSRCAASVV